MESNVYWYQLHPVTTELDSTPEPRSTRTLLLYTPITKYSPYVTFYAIPFAYLYELSQVCFKT